MSALRRELILLAVCEVLTVDSHARRDGALADLVQRSGRTGDQIASRWSVRGIETVASRVDQVARRRQRKDNGICCRSETDIAIICIEPGDASNEDLTCACTAAAGKIELGARDVAATNSTVDSPYVSLQAVQLGMLLTVQSIS